MERTLTNQTIKKVGKLVRLCGWVNARRDHGKLVFVDLKDRRGIVQIVGEESLGNLRISDVVEVKGKVAKRPRQMVNSKIPTGGVEVKVEKIEVLAKSAELPLDIQGDGYQIGEETRLKYRYLDLRRPRLVKNLELRHQVIKFIRDWLDKKGFFEIETPILTKATPEGARDFVVPSRLQPGKFYALPQSPQQYKQLLMVAGLEKYYQIARCFRDEDPRADRAYGEFTQLDLEMSFTSQEEILDLIEELYIRMVETIFPQKKFTFKPFPRLDYDNLIKKYGSDKPDLRKNKNDPDELAFCFVINFPLFEWKKTEDRWDAMHHPFTAPRVEDVPDFLKGKNLGKLKSYQHDLVLNGFEIGGGSIRITDPKLQEKVFEIMGHTKEQIRRKFGHLLEAFEYGVPPHGGIAPGIDRFLMVVLGEPSLREVIAFPMDSGGHTSVMDAPSEVDPEQLKELGVSVGGRKQASNSGGQELFEAIMTLLKKNKMIFKLYEHEPVFTCEQAAKVRGTSVKQGAKALVMVADGRSIMVVLSGSKKLDNKKFKKMFGVDNLRMATREEVKASTGTEIGGVPPFGNLVGLEVFVDKILEENKEIVFNAGLRTRSLKINYADWVKLVEPRTGDFSANE